MTFHVSRLHDVGGGFEPFVFIGLGIIERDVKALHRRFVAHFGPIRANLLRQFCARPRFAVFVVTLEIPRAANRPAVA